MHDQLSFTICHNYSFILLIHVCYSVWKATRMEIKCKRMEWRKMFVFVPSCSRPVDRTERTLTCRYICLIPIQRLKHDLHSYLNVVISFYFLYFIIFWCCLTDQRVYSIYLQDFTSRDGGRGSAGAVGYCRYEYKSYGRLSWDLN